MYSSKCRTNLENTLQSLHVQPLSRPSQLRKGMGWKPCDGLKPDLKVLEFRDNPAAWKGAGSKRVHGRYVWGESAGQETVKKKFCLISLLHKTSLALTGPSGNNEADRHPLPLSVQ